MSFFLSKNIFKCQICITTTTKQTMSEKKLNVAIFELVDLIRTCIDSSLQKKVKASFGLQFQEFTVDKLFAFVYQCNLTSRIDNTSHRESRRWYQTISSSPFPSFIKINSYKLCKNKVLISYICVRYRGC